MNGIIIRMMIIRTILIIILVMTTPIDQRPEDVSLTLVDHVILSNAPMGNGTGGKGVLEPNPSS